MTIYLDNNASTRIDPLVAASMGEWSNGTLYGNPHAGHYLGRLSREAIEKARDQVVKSVFGCGSDWKCIFTSGASESNNLALKGFVFNKIRTSRAKITIITSPVEHSTIDKCLDWLRVIFNIEIFTFEIDQHGIVCLDRAAQLLGSLEHVDMVTCIHCVAETGAIQPVIQIGKIAKKSFPNIIIHTDASQSVGKVENSVLHSLLQYVDLITIAAHKFGGPKGIGALIVNDAIIHHIDPLIHGAGQEYGLRGGTENVANIVGLGTACELVSKRQPSRPTVINTLRDVLCENLESKGAKFRINSTAPEQSPYTLNLSVVGMNGPSLVADLGNHICFSAGSACHSRGPPAPSKVLKAMNVPHEYAISAIRLSVCHNTCVEDARIAAMKIADAICIHVGL